MGKVASTGLIIFALLTLECAFSVKCTELYPGPDQSVSKKKSPSKKAADPTLVHGDRVENVILGKPVKEILSMYPAARIQKVLVYDAKGSYEKLEIMTPDHSSVLFFVEPDCNADSGCVIRRINVTNNLYHSRKNLRVGKFYVDLVRSGESLKEVNWFEGNLIAQSAETGLNYVLQTNFIPRPWYTDMNKDMLPDSTRIIGMMISGNNLRGVSWHAADSINKSMALKKGSHPSGNILSGIHQSGRKHVSTKRSKKKDTALDSTAGMLLESMADSSKSEGSRKSLVK